MKNYLRQFVSFLLFAVFIRMFIGCGGYIFPLGPCDVPPINQSINHKINISVIDQIDNKPISNALVKLTCWCRQYNDNCTPTIVKQYYPEGRTGQNGNITLSFVHIYKNLDQCDVSYNVFVNNYQEKEEFIGSYILPYKGDINKTSYLIKKELNP